MDPVASELVNTGKYDPPPENWTSFRGERDLMIDHPTILDNIFIPKMLEKQCAKNKAVKKDIDEWIDRTESME